MAATMAHVGVDAGSRSDNFTRQSDGEASKTASADTDAAISGVEIK